MVEQPHDVHTFGTHMSTPNTRSALKRPPPVLDIDERTQATYYHSAYYPDGLTPELVLSNERGQPVKNGQVPWPQNRWTHLDPWYFTNNWFHRINDRVPFACFVGWWSGLHNSEIYDQPYVGHLSYSTRKYDDDLWGQTIGGAIIGLQLGAGFGMLHCFNIASEASIFQSMAMQPNTWLPSHKAGFKFRRRIMASCMLQCSSFLATYALVDGLSSTLRQKDDGLNNILGGLAGGGVLWGWFRNPMMTIPTGFIFGAYMMWFRFFIQADGASKPGFSYDKPLWGIFGGVPTWIMGQEPDPDRYFNQWFDKKYRSN